MNKGIILILSGYIIWGLFPLYWVLLNQVPAIEVLAHRMLWSVPVLIIFVVFVKAWRDDFYAVIKDKKELSWLFVTATLITINWGVYILAVNYGKVIEASMGYFLTPLIHVVGGYLVFQERIGPIKKRAISFATLGVLFYVVSVEGFPWIGLVLGLSFASYGILRKRIRALAVSGLLVETLLLTPLSLGYLIYLNINQEAVFLNASLDTDIWLVLAGLVTVVPLVLFTMGARLLSMTTTGILFYITPTIQFLLGVWILNEEMDSYQLIGFVGIWLGLALYTYSLLKNGK